MIQGMDYCGSSSSNDKLHIEFKIVFTRHEYIYLVLCLYLVPPEDNRSHNNSKIN